MQRSLGLLKFAVVVAALFGVTCAHGYKLGGVACAAAPLSAGYCIDAFAQGGYVAAVTNPANFGAGGIVPVPVAVTPLSTFTPADLAGIDGLVVPWWNSADAAPHVASIVSFFLNGGDLFILADNPGNDPINAALLVPSLFGPGSATPKPTSGNAPLHAGPFGAAAVVNGLFAIGRLDVPTVLARGGHIVGNDANGNVTAAVWDKNQYAPGSGRLVIVTDVDMMVSGFPGALASYAPLNDNGRFILNATAFLVNGGSIEGFEYDLVGVPSCATRTDGFLFYCGSTGFTITFQLRAALEDAMNFGGPGAPVARRATLVEFDAFTPQLAATLKAVLIPWIQSSPVSDAAPYATQLRDWYLAGGNLWLLQDDPFHDPIGELLGIPTAGAIGGTRVTNGGAPAFDGPFGGATDVVQGGAMGALDPAQVAARGGTIVGNASDGTNDAVVAVWRDHDYAPGAGRMVISTDVDSLGIAFPLPAGNATWMKNIMAFLLTDPPADTTAPAITCAANPATLWPPNGKSVQVSVSGTITDAGGIAAGSAQFSVVDEYGQVQPAGAVTVNGGGTYAFQVPLIAARDGSDADGRRYTITVRATDTAGNVGSCEAVVTVPHDKGKR